MERSFPFKKRGKLSPMFIGLFEILKRIGIAAYQVALPPSFSRLHFHVLVLRKYMVDPSHVLDYQPRHMSNDMSYEKQPIEVQDK